MFGILLIPPVFIWMVPRHLKVIIMLFVVWSYFDFDIAIPLHLIALAGSAMFSLVMTVTNCLIEGVRAWNESRSQSLVPPHDHDVAVGDFQTDDYEFSLWNILIQIWIVLTIGFATLLCIAVLDEVFRAVRNAWEAKTLNPDQQVQYRKGAIAKRMLKYTVKLFPELKIKFDNEFSWILPRSGNVVDILPRSEDDLGDFLGSLNSAIVDGPCAICFGDYEVGQDVTWSSKKGCRHVFHTECITGWLATPRAYDQLLCPTCSKPFGG